MVNTQLDFFQKYRNFKVSAWLSYHTVEIRQKGVNWHKATKKSCGDVLFI
jgi:hypothetical protein